MAKTAVRPAKADETYDEIYSAFVRKTKPKPRAILDRLDEAHCDLVQVALRIGALAGALVESSTASAVDGGTIDVDRLVGVFGALEFQLEALRQAIGWTREDILGESYTRRVRR